MERLAVIGFVFGMVGGGCTRSFRKTNKNIKRKRNSRRELQGRIIHCLYPLSDGGITLG